MNIYFLFISLLTQFDLYFKGPTVSSKFDAEALIKNNHAIVGEFQRFNLAFNSDGFIVCSTRQFTHLFKSFVWQTVYPHLINVN